jgi:hypothetical protein
MIATSAEPRLSGERFDDHRSADVAITEGESAAWGTPATAEFEVTQPRARAPNHQDFGSWCVASGASGSSKDTTKISDLGMIDRARMALLASNGRTVLSIMGFGSTDRPLVSFMQPSAHLRRDLGSEVPAPINADTADT